MHPGLLRRGSIVRLIRPASMSTSGAIQRFETCRRWSEAVVHNGTVYLAGQLADAPEGDIEAQTRQMLAAVENALRLAGSNKNKLLSCTIFLKSMSDYAAFNRIWDEWIHEGHAPARACVQAALAKEGYLVEISVIAAV